MSGEANAYLAELRAENARLREVVRRVEGLAADLCSYVVARGRPQTGTYDDGLNRAQASVAADIRAALGSMDTGPAPAGAHAATQGAGDGV